MKAKNKIKYKFQLGDFKIITFIPKSRAKRKKLVGTGNCSLESCKNLTRKRYKTLLHGNLHGIGIQRMAEIWNKLG